MKTDDDQAKRDEDRLDSFLNFLFGIDSGVAVFFLWFVRGSKLGDSLPFQLAFLPFKLQALMLAACALWIILLRGLNLFWHDSPCFRRFSKWSALAVMVVSLIAIGWGGWALIQNPDLLTDGKD